jgi:DNA-binding MarR family transcriptional regulator
LTNKLKYITEEGKYMATEIKNIMEKLIEEKFKSFTDEEIGEFNNALNIIAKFTAK